MALRIAGAVYMNVKHTSYYCTLFTVSGRLQTSSDVFAAMLRIYTTSDSTKPFFYRSIDIIIFRGTSQDKFRPFCWFGYGTPWFHKVVTWALRKVTTSVSYLPRTQVQVIFYSCRRSARYPVWKSSLSFLLFDFLAVTM
jgi:hypothetical protein